MSYLGKISALVSVNTGDFAPKLNAAAKDVRAFARTVESSIGSSMRSAAKSFADIYTPLQKFERALRAATSQKLNFVGLPGAIRSIEELRTRLGTLNARQVSVVLRTTGLKDIEQFRAAVQGVTSRSLNVMLKVGGVDQLQALRKQMVERAGAQSLEIKVDTAKQRLAEVNERLSALRQEAGNVPVTITADATEYQRLNGEIDKALEKQTRLTRRQNKVQIGSEEYDKLEKQLVSIGRTIDKLQAKRGNIGVVSDLEKAAAEAAVAERNLARLQKQFERRVGTDQRTGMGISGIDETLNSLKTLGLTGKQVKAVIDNLLQSDATAFATQLRQTKSAAEEIAGPLSKAAALFASMPAAVQGEFLPSLISAQKATKALTDEIVRSGSVSEERFEAVARKVNLTIEAIDRLSEASQIVSKLESGAGLKATSPRQFDALNSAAAADRRASALSGDAASAFGIGGQQSAVSRQAKEVERLLAQRERLARRGKSTDRVDAAIDQETSRLEAQVRVYERLIDAAMKLELVRKGGFVSADTLETSARDQKRRQAREQFRPSQGDPVGSYGPTRGDFYTDVSERMAAAERERRRQRANREFKPIPGNPNGPYGPTGGDFMTDVRERLAQRQREGIRAELGRGLGDPERQMGRLSASITGIKSQLDSLPEGVRTHFIPAIQAAEQEFTRLRVLGAAATAEEIENAANNMRVLEAAARRASTAQGFQDRLGGRNAQEFELNLQGRSLKGYQAQLQILQQALGRVSTEARGPAVASFLTLQNAITDAFEQGTLDSQATRAELQRLTQQAVQATARVANIGVGTLGRQVARAGDVGRQGFDTFSLAANQAAFAIDDFLSSTGGIEFKLRAISNNITQLAFILGGTTGLFIGLGAVIGGQVAVGLMKWANGGRTAEDITKSLNDALARQKSLVEELAQAFKSLGDAMSRGAFSDASEQGRDFGRQLDEIKKKQKESRQAAVAGTDYTVQQERANQSRYKRELESSTDPGRRVALEALIKESERREQRAARAASMARVPGGLVRQRVEESVLMSESAAARRDIPNDEEYARRLTVARERAAAAGRGVNTGNTVEAKKTQIAALESARSGLANASEERMFGMRTQAAAEADRQLALVDNLLKSLQAELSEAIDTLAVDVARSSYNASRQIANAQQDVAEAIRRGVPLAGTFQAELDRLAGELDAANASLEAAQKLEDPAAKEAAVNRARGRVEAVEGQRAEVESRSLAVRLGRGFGGERTTSAVSRLQGNDRFESERGGVTAAARRAADDELVARRRFEDALGREAQARQQVLAAEDAVAQAKTEVEKEVARQALATAEENQRAAVEARKKADADAQAAAKASDAAASLAEFALSVEQAIARLRKIGDSALQRSEGGADAAQRALEEGRGTAVARDAAERALIADRERVAKAQNALDQTRSEAMNSPQMQAIRQERERLESQKKEEESLVAQGKMGPQDPQAVRQREDRLAELRRQEEEAMDEATRKRREELDAIAKSIAARERELERGRKRDEEGNEFNRQRGMVDDTAAAAERRRDEAQGRVDINPSLENRFGLGQASKEVARSRERQQVLQDRMDREEREFNNRDDVKEIRGAIAKREEERAALIAKEAGGTPLTKAEKDRIEQIDRENRYARGSIEEKREGATADTRKEISRERQRQARLEAADRGRELGMTDRERARRDAEEGVGFDIRARAEQMKAEMRRLEEIRDSQKALGVDTTDVDALIKKRNDAGGVDGFIRQALANQMEQIAPMLFQFQQERENAMLQGPSRAALQVSDVTTGQGMSELNRLLRGDDASKDVNLAELRKQTDRLDELIDVVKNNPLPVI